MKVLAAILRQIKVFTAFIPLPGHAGYSKALHLVHPVMAQFAPPMLPAHQIIVFIAPDQAVGGDEIPLPLPAEDPLFFGVIVEIAEGHRLSPGDGGVELVNGVIDAFVVGLYPAVHIDLPPELPGLIPAGQPLQLADEGLTLFPGDKP